VAATPNYLRQASQNLGKYLSRISSLLCSLRVVPTAAGGALVVRTLPSPYVVVGRVLLVYSLISYFCQKSGIRMNLPAPSSGTARARARLLQLPHATTLARAGGPSQKSRCAPAGRYALPVIDDLAAVRRKLPNA